MLKRSDLHSLLNSLDYSELLEQLTDQLMDIATKSNWPENIIYSLSVKMDESHNIFVDYPPALSEQINELEYGSPGTLPNAVIRPFMYRAPHLLTQFVEQSFVPLLLDEIGAL